ncbi:PilZ domain-containing protein [Saccharospirillum alexandrii]|jgi:c-di-GMP-binding flagellar brake protein YcgR|uniref:PilZ domain-containing protein n=1 Tax=Saccharospirillum alexandrii TaxID=2448477 RepID=UPI00171C2677
MVDYGIVSQREEYSVRQYIRHPAAVPLKYQCQQPTEPNPTELLDISQGGLSFITEEALEPGQIVQVSIGVGDPPFETKGQVVWCHPQDDHFVIGLRFDNLENAFAVRMVEQICHIEQYRQQWERQGRDLTPEEAAREWIDLHARDFPAWLGEPNPK